MMMRSMMRPDDESLQNSNKILKSSLLILNTSPHTLPSSSFCLFYCFSAFGRFDDDDDEEAGHRRLCHHPTSCTTSMLGLYSTARRSCLH